MTSELTRAMTLILIALSNEGQHGYLIMQAIAGWGLYYVGPGTLYRSLGNLLERGFITEQRRHADDDVRRRYYRITEQGRMAVQAELGRIETLLRVAREAGL